MKSALLYLCLTLRVFSSEGADVDFSTQRLPIQVPPEESSFWRSNKGSAIMTTVFGGPVEGGLSYAAGEVSSWIFNRDKVEKNTLIGHVICPKTLVAENSDHKRGLFSIRRLAVQYALEPEVNGLEKLRKRLKSFRVVFSIKAGNVNNIQVADIIPSTAFVDACISGKISINSKIGLARSGRFEMTETGSSAAVEAGFSWIYQPKDLVVASSFVGNTATLDFQQKNDGTFHVGQVPVEISLLVPADVQEAELSIITTVISNKDVVVPAGEAKVKILF